MEKVTFRTVCLFFLLLSFSAYSQTGETINGQVLYHGLYPHAGVTAMLHDINGNIIDVTTSDGSGNYAFYNVAGGTYSISFEKTGPAGGVTLTDAFLVMMHLFNLYPFSPIAYLAADVDGSGTITWADYTLILVGYLNQGNPFPIGDWVFEEVPPFSTGSRSETKVSGSNGSGDVNGTFVPTKMVESVFVNLPANDVVIKPGEVSNVTVNVANTVQMTGMQLILRIPDGIVIKNIESPLQNLNHCVRGNELTLTWLDENAAGEVIRPDASLFSIEATVTKSWDKNVSHSFYVLPESHFIDQEGEVIHGVQIVIPSLKFQPAEEFNLTAYPNPFTTHFSIGLDLPSDGQVSFQLFDQCGRIVHEIINSYYNAGTHQLRFDGSFLTPGIYFYHVSLPGNEKYFSNGSIIKSK
ncbi:MAG: T9SS type A sorting domain-containing protein [Bacteroidales bacterium]|nr:T9SS type A sorting domain-containing protein [Bacteroidales bacterium]